MYIVYSEHPKTLVKTVRSIHKTYAEAAKVLKEMAMEYITKTKSYHQVIFINDLEDTKKNPECKYFIMNSDEYSARYMVYEQKTEVDRGWIRNGIKMNVQEIMMFSILNIDTILNEEVEEKEIDNIVKTSNKLKMQKNEYTEKNKLVIEDMKAFLEKNKDKFVF